MLESLTGFVVVGVAILVGWILGRIDLLGEHARPVLARLTFFVLSPFLLWRVVLVSGLFASVVLLVFFGTLGRGEDLPTARTMVVNTIVVIEIFYLFSVRYIHGTSLTFRGVLGTPAVLIAVALVVVAQFAFTYLPFMQALFATEAVSLPDGMLIVGIGVALLIVVELEKRLAAAVSGRA